MSEHDLREILAWIRLLNVKVDQIQSSIDEILAERTYPRPIAILVNPA